ncbi:Zinc resistance conferring protein [Lithohypha guttulata]|uniref:Zinc resistance conferring protein n=1 Tax=Lithohypha guttulata TaxID=1690604 RepID=A0AAN7T1V7_9EURO|nr:Zinc resistance conferring protein [Lithohypha guttulata]KAK5094952.1 Zinc resistance conferring protein [Lithohypha guttulata]
MALSKSQRICILLAIDAAFFFVELIVGYAVHSLALVADAFHMLNDVMSLCVGLWAVRVASSGSSKMYTYGWQRAETLGALVNGVFLVALCVTIFLEAIQRFVEKPNVSNPKLVLIVGCLGLASNILGLVLFHDVSHNHGPGDGHAHGDEEEGHVHGDTHSPSHGQGHGHEHEHTHATEQSPLMKKSPKSTRFTSADEDGTTINSEATPNRRSVSGSGHGHRRRTSGFGSVDNIQIHPASFRNDIIQAARYQEEPLEEEALLEGDTEESNGHDHVHSSPSRNLKSNRHTYGATSVEIANAHQNHIHSQPKDSAAGGGGGHGHSHADLNMRGVFLHVLGDALGNIGVIATALIIWLTKFEGRFYFDPAISLVITAIILTSAIPLCKAASRILLQAVPMGLSIDEIRADIEDLPQVLEAHHLHVWQLSDTKLVASLHVKVDCDVKGAGSASYMKLAREIRACLHGYGIHSSTIQPEFMRSVQQKDLPHDDHEGSSSGTENLTENGKIDMASKAGSMLSADGHAAGPGCMMDCEDTCGSNGQCCPSTDGKGQR